MGDIGHGVVTLNANTLHPNHQNNDVPPPPRVPSVPRMPQMRQAAHQDLAMPRPPMGMPPALHQFHSHSVPPPPDHSVPMDLRPRQRVETFDIRSENMTESDAREQLSTYTVVRMEKTNRDHDIDEVGDAVRPTWEMAQHIEVTDMDQTAARRRVRDLNKFTDSVANKKAEFSKAIKRQIEIAQERLEATNDDQRFCYHLAQLEWQDKEMDERRIQQMYGVTKSVAKTKDGMTTVRTYTEVPKAKSKSKHKRRKERVSVTAYFKKTPVPGVDAMAMLQNANWPQQAQVWPAAQIMHQPHRASLPAITHQQPHNMLGAPIPQDRGHRGHGGHGLPNIIPGDRGGRMKESTRDKQYNPRGGTVVVVGGGQKAGRRYNPRRPPPRDSNSSITESEDFWSDDESDMTPESSVSSSHRRGRSGHRERREEFGIEAPRRHSRHDFEFEQPLRLRIEQNPRRSDPLGFGRRSSLDDLFHGGGELRDGPTLRGRGGQPAPAVFQGPAHVRRVPVMEARREIFADEMDRMDDGFGRMRMEDERDFILDPRERDFGPRRHADLTPRGRRPAPGSLDDDFWTSPRRFDDGPQRRGESFVRVRDRSPIGLEQENPFAPRPRRSPFFADGRDF